MKKRIFVALFLIAAFLICSATASGSPGINNSNLFYRWLADSGTPEYSVSGVYRANYETYKDYGLVVYGTHSSVPGNDYRDGEYRYLGYTFLESLYTNQLFPNDASFGNIPENWDYIDVAGAGESWDSLEQSIQKPYMLYTKLSGHGATSLTAYDIGISKTRIQSPATWMNPGSIYTHKSNGYYATFSIPPMGMGELTAIMDSDRDCINTDGSSNSTMVNLNVRASVNKPKGEVRFIKIAFHLPAGDRVRFFHNTNSVDINQQVRIEIPENLPDSIRINATVTSESIFGDKLQKNLSCTVNICEEVPVTPSLMPHEPTAAPGPPVTTPAPTGTPVPPPTPSATPSPVPAPVDDEYTPLRTVELWGDWNYWDESPHRFMSLEKIHLNVTVLGPVKDIVVRLSSKLEKMHYTNSEGHTYDYSEDFFGYYVYFPGDSTIIPDYSAWLFPRAEWEYILPLCDETISWNGTRLRPPYRMTITANGSGGRTQTMVIDDIDITGNVFELLHPQPVQ